MMFEELSAVEAVASPGVWERLRRHILRQPEARALHIDGRWFTYAELGEEIGRTAAALAGAGAAPGGRVGVMLPNGLPFMRAWLALAALNITMVPINVNLVGAGLRHILLGVDLDLLLVDAPLLPAVYAACGEVPPARRVLVQGEPSLRAGVEPFAPLLAAAPAELPPLVPVDPADDALIIYTSGTTGPSKGVVLSRAAQLWHGLNYLRDFIRIGPGEAGYTPLPLFHVSAQGFSLGCLLGGAAVAVDLRFSAFTFWDAVRRYNAKAFNYVGAMVPLLYHRSPRPDDADNPVERAVGSATSPELHEPFERRFGLRLIESYGQSETAGLWLSDPPEGRRIGAVGKPVRWMEAAILREDGSEADAGESGEICLRPEHPLLMTRGYVNDPETTARAFRDGWYHAGDAGVRDADGYIAFRGRLKDFMRRRGENISAWEIEREALSHPAVREAAAAPVPSELGEDEVKLSVLLHEGASVTPAQLDRHLRPRLAAFMRPRYIEIRTRDFPRTPTQRVQKFLLREEGVTEETWDRKGSRKGAKAKSENASTL